MKKRILISILFLVVMAQTHIFAQEQGVFRFGVDAALGTESSIANDGNVGAGIGITFVGDYFITDAINVSLGYTLFFSSSFSSPALDVRLESSTVDIDGKYYFSNEAFGIYGLFGISQGFSLLTTTIDLGNGKRTDLFNDNKFAINMGAGADYHLTERLFLNGQVKYNLALEQVVFNLGVGVSLN